MNNNKLNNLYYITDVRLKKNNGPSLHVFQLVRNLARLGITVHVFFPKGSDVVSQSEKEIRWIPITIPSYASFLQNQLFQLLILCKLIRLPKSDAIYLRFSGSMIAPPLWSRVTGVPFFVEINGNIHEERRLLARKIFVLRKWIQIVQIHTAEYLNLVWSNGVIVVDEELRNFYRTRYGTFKADKIQVIHNGADIEVFRPCNKECVIKNLALDENEYIIGYVGTVAPWYNLYDTIKAIRILRRRNIGCRLVIVGGGRECGQLMELTRKLNLEEHVIFTGVVPFKHVPLYINAFDIALIPLKDENAGFRSPLKLHEYMACARPIVATRVSSLELVEKIGVGVLFNNGSPQSLAEAIENLIRRQAEWNIMGKRGREYVEKYASWKKVAERTLDFIVQKIRQCGK